MSGTPALRLGNLFALTENPVISKFVGCPTLMGLKQGHRLAPVASEENAAKLEKLFATYLETGDGQDLAAARNHARASVRVGSVDYCQAACMCRFGAAMGQVDARATEDLYQSKVAKHVAKNDKVERIRTFFSSVTCDDKVPSTIGVGETDIIGVISVAAVHNGFATRIARLPDPEIVTNNIIELSPALFRSRDGGTHVSMATFMAVEVPPAPATMGALFLAKDGAGDLTVKQQATETTVTPDMQQGREGASVLNPTDIAAFLVNCDCLDESQGDKCPRSLKALTQHMLDAMKSLDALSFGKEFTRPIVTFTNHQVAVALARNLSKSSKSKLDIVSFASPLDDGVCVSVRRVSEKDFAVETRAVHLAGAIYWMEFGHQKYSADVSIINSLLPESAHEFYLREYVGANTYAGYQSRARMFVNGKFVPLMEVLGRYLDRVSRNVRSQAQADKTKTDGGGAASAAGGGGGGKSKERRVRKKKGDTAKSSSPSDAPAKVGCLPCKTADSVSSLYRS